MQHGDLRKNPAVRELFERQLFDISVRVDRVFAYLMMVQWAFALIIAISLSPKTSIGQEPYSYILVALVFGGLLSLGPVFSIFAFPGRAVTRYLIGIGQLSYSALLIYLSGGRIETHFHIFVSLALLAFYQDVYLICLACALAVLDHIVRGYLLPVSIYGVATGVEWRWIEHAGWILFECIIVNYGIQRMRAEIFGMALSKYHLIQAKEEAERGMQTKSQFLSNMSHEIRTPLNSIIGFTDVLKETKLEKEQAYYVDTIHRCSDALLHVINDILDLSKIENGVIQLERHQFDLRELHKDLHKMFSIDCAKKGLELNVVLDAKVPSFMMGDSYRIRQVLTNLIGNAVKFTEKGRIDVSLRHDTNCLYWEVSDTGIGMKPESLKLLFRRFTQEDSSTTRKFGGTGLGLVISKNLVELMGGSIAVESKLGQGTKFSFKIPVEES